MCTYEFAEVDLDCPPAAAVPDGLSWRPISDESGQNMLNLKKAKVHASTHRLCQDAHHPNGPKAYCFDWSMPITSCGDPHPAVTLMVKYIHCSRGHAILVRRAGELEVVVTTTDLSKGPDPDPLDTGMQLVKVVANVGTVTVLDKYMAKEDKPQKLSSIANSIRATIAFKNIGTIQTKILWTLQGQKTTLAKQLIQKKTPGILRRR